MGHPTRSRSKSKELPAVSTILPSPETCSLAQPNSSRLEITFPATGVPVWNTEATVPVGGHSRDRDPPRLIPSRSLHTIAGPRFPHSPLRAPPSPSPSRAPEVLLLHNNFTPSSLIMVKGGRTNNTIPHSSFPPGDDDDDGDPNLH